MIPLYGFLEGDTVGLLVLAQATDTPDVLARKLQQAARVRVAAWDEVEVRHRGRALQPNETVERAGLTALDRIDVVRVPGRVDAGVDAGRGRK